MKRTLAPLAAVAALGCVEAPAPAVVEAEVVYGADDRRERYEVPAGPIRDVADTAVATLVSARSIDERDPSSVRVVYGRTLGEAQSLCPGERFAEQPEPGTCSGTLIDARHLLTAGHCVDGPSACDGSRVWLFGFAYDAPGALAPLDADDVYRCRRVVSAVQDGEVDHAVVELDRDVVGHAPAPLRTAAGPLPVGAALTLVGHPNGIPMKIAGGAVVLSTTARTLRASVDAFAANSGSGVFDADGRLAAILDSGATDYVDRGGCQVVNVLDPAASDGEGLTSLAPALDAFCATPGVASPICGCGGAPCVERPPGDTCADARPVPTQAGTFTAALSGFASDTQGSCGGTGPDRVYSFTLDAASRVVVSARGGDPVLYLRAGCEGPERACNDDVSRDDRSARLDTTLPAGTYALFVDAYDASAGDVAVTIAITASAGRLDAGGAADAGAPGVPDASAPDASAPDAGAAPPVSSGCACRVGHAGAARSTLAGIAAAIAALVGRRRARPRRFSAQRRRRRRRDTASATPATSARPGAPLDAPATPHAQPPLERVRRRPASSSTIAPPSSPSGGGSPASRPGSIGPASSPGIGVPASGRGTSTHAPASQRCPSGQAAPVHASTQAPSTQAVPGAHVTDAHAAGTQRPSAAQASPASHARQGQRVRHVPSSQTVPSSHVTPAHASTQRPARHS